MCRLRRLAKKREDIIYPGQYDNANVSSLSPPPPNPPYELTPQRIGKPTKNGPARKSSNNSRKSTSSVPLLAQAAVSPAPRPTSSPKNHPSTPSACSMSLVIRHLAHDTMRTSTRAAFPGPRPSIPLWMCHRWSLSACPCVSLERASSLGRRLVRHLRDCWII